MTTLSPNLIADLERKRDRQRAAVFAIARESFTYCDSVVGRVPIARGERVVPGHEVVRRYPDRFDIGSTRSMRSSRPELNAVRDTTAPRDDALPTAPWSLGLGKGLLSGGTVELRDSTSPITVRIGERCRAEIQRIAEATPHGFETGGILLAHRSYDRSVIELVDAWPPGPSAIRKRNSLALNWATDHSRARDLANKNDAATIVGGCWHTHPGAASGTPSEPDLAMFGAAMRHASASVWPLHHYVALIATSVGRSAGPDLTAWVTREQRFAKLICEPAVIER